MNSLSKNVDRILWLDGVKIIAIFLVIFIHSASTPQIPPITRVDWAILVIFDSITRVCVPLFVMASGALLLGKLEPYTVFFKKRINRIILPWIFWTVVYLGIFAALNKISLTTFSDFINQLYKLSFSYFWFMPMISGLYVLTPLIRLWLHKTRNIHVIYALLLWIVVYSILPFCLKLVIPAFQIPNPFIFEHLGYFILGYILFKIPQIPLKANQLMLILVACFMANSTGTFLAYVFSRPDLQTYFWSNLSLFAIIAAICTFLLIKTFFERIKSALSTSAKKLIIGISEASLGVYLIHALILNLLPLSQLVTHMPYAFKIILVTTIVFTVSLSIIVMLQRTPLRRIIA